MEISQWIKSEKKVLVKSFNKIGINFRNAYSILVFHSPGVDLSASVEENLDDVDVTPRSSQAKRCVVGNVAVFLVGSPQQQQLHNLSNKKNQLCIIARGRKTITITSICCEQILKAVLPPVGLLNMPRRGVCLWFSLTEPQCLHLCPGVPRPLRHGQQWQPESKE